MATRIIEARLKSDGSLAQSVTLTDDTVDTLHIPTALPNLNPGLTYEIHLATPTIDYTVPNDTTNTGPQSAMINVAQRSFSQVAPEAMLFTVDLTGFDTAGPTGAEVYDARLHEVYYHWDFGDSYTYSSLTKTPAAFRESRYGSGPVGSHTYRAPGTYTVTCTVFEPSSGKAAVATTTVTVGDPDTLFAADNQTIVVDTTGAGLAAYPNATVVTSFEGMISTIKGFNDEATPRRVILRRGQSFTAGGSKVGDSSWPTTHIMAESGNGAAPTVTATDNLLVLKNAGGNTNKDFVMQGIDLVGGWDATTETGDLYNGLAVWNNPPQQLLLDGVVMRDFGGRALSTTENDIAAHPYKFFLNDCHIDGWRFYGIYLASAHVVSMTGTKIEQDPLANAGGAKDNAHNNHGPFRIARADSTTKVVAQGVEFFSRNDWSAASGIYSQQPCWRFDTSGVGGGFFSIHGSVMEGGADIIATGTQSDAGSNSHRINAVIAQNYLLGSHITRTHVHVEKAGVTIRNNVMTFPDTPHYPVWGPQQFVQANWDGVVAGENGAPIRVYNNTLINLSNAPVPEIDDDGSFTDVVSANNLFYQSNATPSSTADGPLDSTSLFTPSEVGYKHNSEYGDGLDTLQTAYATDAADVWLGAPLSGAGVLGDADEALPFAYDDFWGNVRPQYPARGAFETS